MRRRIKSAMALLVWLLIWQAASMWAGQTLLLPSPIETLRALCIMLAAASFWASTALSIFRILLGFALGALAGFLLAVLTHRIVFLNALLLPFLSSVKAAPVVSFILLAYVWLSPSGVPVFATALIVLPIVFSNLSAGLAGMDPLLLEMGKGFRLSRRKMIHALYFPMISPYARAAAAAGMGMAWKAGIAAEVIATPKMALGSIIYDSKIYLDTPGLFASTLVVILLSILLEKGLLRLLYPRKEAKR